MASDPLVSTSKFLSLILRHRPELVGLKLGPDGWVEVNALLAACARHGRPITREQLEQVVARNDKQRFALSHDHRSIRANQGHSVEVELGHQEAEPPEILYHGTSAQALDAIRRQGLKKMRRHHVHLSQDRQHTMAVGSRRGRPVLVTVQAGRMFRDGHVFMVTPNKVWLVDCVPPEYLELP